MRTYVVLGTGRSGTSFFTSCLKNNGVHIPERTNDYFESDDFKQLNIDILKAAGGDHWNPPSRSSIIGVRGEFDKRIRNTIRMHEKEMWGWKDPRTTLTFDLYLPHLRGDVYVIYCLRTFSEVIKSLSERVGWAHKEHAEKMVQIYRERLHDIIDIMAEL